MKISKQHLRAFEPAVVLDPFEDETVPYLQNLAPRHARMIGEVGLRRAIRLGVERAAPHGITNPGLLRFYIELMFCFGSFFDTDPLLPWARAVLDDGSIEDQLTRSKKLHEAMSNYLDIVADPGTAMSLKALRSIKDVRPADYRVSDPTFEDRVLAEMRRIYPERCAYLGERCLREAIRCGPKVAASRGIGTDSGIVLTIGLMFIVGHGFAVDPLQPWIQATLENPNITTPERRAERLERRMRIYLEEVLEPLEQRRNDVQG